ncbi:hypothetical protein HPB52_001783 [Rhipicephalus sanguineus]|uniref:Uncharacterized protein n=1 Tax=Rhipicephalus sanguineus TaxID=34632 RepID=A0A9D4QE09_RHISA|nr:hypothetical protein HPB52_001783 [Rhipicephalus sanguineus]
MTEGTELFVYRVRGFGSHVECKLVEFTRELDAVSVCSWCGAVTKENTNLFYCGDIACKECSDEVGSGTCPVHGRTLSRFMEVQWRQSYSLGSEKVRCVNARRGCKYEDTLLNLDSHLKNSCAFNIIACVRCGRGVPYKDMRAHFTTCVGTSQASSSSSDAVSLVDDLGNVRKKLDRALTLVKSDGEHSELYKTVIAASELFYRVQTQLAMEGWRGLPRRTVRTQGHNSLPPEPVCRRLQFVAEPLESDAATLRLPTSSRQVTAPQPRLRH